MSESVSSKSMRKWGIPEKKRVPNELTLLERLVWVKYKGHWWPALLYQNYSELQHHLYNKLDVAMKAQFAMAILRQMEDSTVKVRVARLLGRPVLEVVEVLDGNYAEFYWQLPHVLPKACHKSRYGNDIDLYIDFHRALDQVEEIIRDVSQHSFNLLPSADKKTWEQRAREAIKDGEVSTSAPKPPKPAAIQAFEAKEAKEAKEAELKAKADSGFFGTMDAIMESITKSFDAIAGDDVPEPTATKSKAVPTKNSPDYSNASTPVRTNLAHFVSQPKSDRYTIPSTQQENNYGTRTGTYGTRSSSFMNEAQEARDPSNEYYDHRSRNGKGDNSSRGSNRKSFQRRTSVELLPGLEADDIVPGITGTGVWQNVLEHMLVCRDGSDNKLEESSAVLRRNLYDARDARKNHHQRQPSYDILMEETATVPAVEIAPKMKSTSYNAMTSPGRPILPPRTRPQESYLERIRPDETRGSIDPDTIVAEDAQTVRVESDDTLWGFLTCRATTDF